ncbi:MAG: DUF4982 domain-containing protein [Anaerolineae bacterium]|nr:DUF4982 domain-containing protein [Anaerolineae bacterium]
MKKTEARQCLSLDSGWRFALGHASDAHKDFDNGTGYFSYFAKTGYGDGAAAQHFDDRGWRQLDVPHDWCVELPFDARGGHSHGYKAIGRNFPENSVGWYRRTFFIPEEDLGKRISIDFDGVHRDSIVWVNGFYAGTEHSGSTGFSYDISDYLNYGGDNVVAVRVDATLEEGWYYEGAGIYRHVRLTKTHPLHVARYGTLVTTDLEEDAALITTRTTVVNESREPLLFDIEETILDAEGKSLLSGSTRQLSLQPGEQQEYHSHYRLEHAHLWSLETPYLHKLATVIQSKGEVVDEYETPFGIRTVRFDPDEGFLLNGQHIKIVGTNIHQDHAGVGVAIPDALHEYRIRRLQDMGSNAIRTAHNPPAPEFLDACDRLGMLVLDENRLMGCNEEHFHCLERLVKRDRNHPSVILWSLGNEEWAIEGNIKGARITETMQTFAQRLDSSRPFTVACSGGWDSGTGMVAQVMGYNYMVQGDIDAHHEKFPWQASIGTEETTTHQTRGIHEGGPQPAHIPPTNRLPEDVGTESGWQFYAARPFLAGLFYWTGFDYRGEATPFDWPAVLNQSGMMDLCGFPKDSFYYLKAWWGKTPLLHIAPHWNWEGRQGEEIDVTVYGNCEEVVLSLNDQDLGTQTLPHNGHLQWRVRYQPGTLLARGYTGGEEVAAAQVKNTGEPAIIRLLADKGKIAADGEDVSVITVEVCDEQGLVVPTANHVIHFDLEGPGKIIGVGNGDPVSHAAERFFEAVTNAKIGSLKELGVEDLDNRPEVAAGFDDSEWPPPFHSRSANWQDDTALPVVIRGMFELADFSNEAEINLFSKSIVEDQSIYINGHLLAANIERDDPNQAFALAHNILKVGRNEYAVTGRRLCRKTMWDEPNTDPGLAQVIEPAERWRRRAFNGLAQIIVQSARQTGEITLAARSEGLAQAVMKIQSQAATHRNEP